MSGENVMTQGGTDMFMAVLKKGRVRVMKDHQDVAEISEPGAIFGEMAVILQKPHTATVRAIESSDFYIISDPQAFLWEKAEFNFEILRILAHRLEDLTTFLAHQKHDAETMDEATHLIEEMIGKLAHHPPGISSDN